uniref:Uncharacterized protein n=1 Tax=Arundo donax TaxID=35708 RepID=A0A0A9AEC3_ARUDO
MGFNSKYILTYFCCFAARSYL